MEDAADSYTRADPARFGLRVHPLGLSESRFTYKDLRNTLDERESGDAVRYRRKWLV
jgi:hypothetical protein